MADLPFYGEWVQPWDPKAWDALSTALGLGETGLSGALIGSACSFVWDTAGGLGTGLVSFVEGLL